MCGMHIILLIRFGHNGMPNQQPFLSNIEQLSNNNCADPYLRSDVNQAELAHWLGSLFTFHWPGCAVRTDIGFALG
jgi:hypothetical protein